MFCVEIGGRTVLYTGDYSMEDDRHLSKAETPNVQPDLLVIESTYGTQVHPTREEREAIFTGAVDSIVQQGGRCLIPVFALGRAQELLLILDEYWQANPSLQSIPIWYASKLASKALRVYQTYVNMMNLRIRNAMDLGNPFQFKHVRNLKSIDVDSFDDRSASVVFASPGMLQSGVSRKLFDRWAGDSRNGVIIAGYAVENTLARDLVSEPDEVTTLDGTRQARNCSVVVVSFSAHVDFVQNRDFMLSLSPSNIIFVHGQQNEMRRLREAMKVEFRKRHRKEKKEPPRLSMPDNGKKVVLHFGQRKQAVVIGKLAEGETPKGEGDGLKGVMFTRNFQTRICSTADLPTYTQLRVGNVRSKLHVPYVGTVSVLGHFLASMFDPVGTESTDEATVLTLCRGSVTCTVPSGGKEVVIEWPASPVNDMVADAAVALVMHSQSNAAAVKMTGVSCCQHRGKDRKGRIKMAARVLKGQFDRVEEDLELGKFKIFCTRKPNLEVGNGEGEGDADADGDADGDGEEDAEEAPGLECNVTMNFMDSSDNCEILVECEDKAVEKIVSNCLKQLDEGGRPIVV